MRKKIIGIFLTLVILTSTSIVSAVDQTSLENKDQSTPKVSIMMNDPGHGSGP
ncbi:hypothetical protein [Paraliobacillus ryukyuensis]|uniref:hypothetical protein n=1 Tax=Paraliobacillus ryukyuensis TaxID=200904 RepID=UPI00147439D4|nr:hypothetical protein [Paraliobacillus ryukyuensis]